MPAPTTIDAVRSSEARAAARDSGLFLQALATAYALMAHADGRSASAERQRLLDLVRETPGFEHVAIDALAADVAAHEFNFRRDPEAAERTAWDRLVPIAGQRRAAHVLLTACRELIPADGVAHPAEYRTLAAIRSRLGIDGIPPHA